MRLKSGSTPTTKIGYTNSNNQMCRGHRDKSGNLEGQTAYKMYCRDCGAEYGVNGADIHLRKCPACQGGASGIEY